MQPGHSAAPSCLSGRSLVAAAEVDVAVEPSSVFAAAEIAG